MAPLQSHMTAPRREVPVGWLASYRLEHRSEAGWRDAQLLELSEAGATLELRGLTALSEVLDGPLELNLVTSAGDPDAICLRGEIRRAISTSDHRVCAGIQFVDLNTDAAPLLELLNRPG